MMVGIWLGYKEVSRENILEKGIKSKRFEEFVWLEFERELIGFGLYFVCIYRSYARFF